MTAPKGKIQQEEERYVLIFVVLGLVLLSVAFTVGFADPKPPMTITAVGSTPCQNMHD